MLNVSMSWRQFLFCVFFAVVTNFCGCAQNEKFFKQAHKDTIDIKYRLAEIEKKNKIIERSIGKLSGRMENLEERNFLEKDKQEALFKLDKNGYKKVSSNSMKINGLELEIFQIKSDVAAQKEKALLITKRLNKLSKKRVIFSSKPVKYSPPSKKHKKISVPSVVHKKQKTEILYQDARTLLDLGEFEEAIKKFRAFGKSFPNSKLADNAQYWIGECYYALKEYDKSIKEFQKVVDGSFMDKNKAPDALLKKAFAYVELMRYDLALSTLKKVVAAYENKAAFQYVVGRARAKIAEISSIGQ